MTRFCIRTVALALAIAWTTPARAGGIVLESYIGEQPADASRLVTPILDELAGRNFSAGDTLARTYEAAASRPALSAGGLPADFAAQVDRGFKAWVGGKFDDAIKTLTPLVDTAHANPGAFAKNQDLRDPLLKALIALALSQQRTGDPAATRATFVEILRAFPDTQLARATYGPEAAELFDQVRRETLAAGRGKLTVKVANEAAVVFIDEAFRAVGSTTADLVPGEYRVCVMLDKQPTRSHRVVVRANAETTLEVDPKLDQAVRTVGFTGFSFASGAERDAHEAAYAAQLANVIGATAVAVVGIEDVRGHAAIVGSLISLQSGREIRRASVALDPDPSTERLRALARFLGGDDPAAGLDVELGGSKSRRFDSPLAGGRGAASDDPPNSAASGGRWSGYQWIAGTLGGVALVAGGVLLAENGHCSMASTAGRPCNDVYNTATPGYVALGSGVVLASVAIVLVVTGGSHPARTAFVAPAPGGAFAGYAMTW